MQRDYPRPSFPSPCAGLSGTAIAMVGADKPLEHYVNCLKSNGVLLFGAKFVVTAPVVYHYLGGLRHLVRRIALASAMPYHPLVARTTLLVVYSCLLSLCR
jgi:hypothetical protein